MFERKHLLHTLSVLAPSVIITALVFNDSRDPMFFFMFPVFLLVAFRLGMAGTVVNILLVTLMAIGFTVKGSGPLMLISGEHMLLHRIVIAQLFAAVAIFTMFPVAALLEEKEALKNSLTESEARFRNLAHVDELTGLPNRRAFNLQFEQAWSEAFAANKPLGLVILDADHFKQYNDDIGHPAGDACLRKIAHVLVATIDPAEGFPARIGGEEFAVVLTGTTQSRAHELAEKIRRSVEDLGSAPLLQSLRRTNRKRGGRHSHALPRPAFDRHDENGRSGPLRRQARRPQPGHRRVKFTCPSNLWTGAPHNAAVQY